MRKITIKTKNELKEVNAYEIADIDALLQVIAREISWKHKIDYDPETETRQYHYYANYQISFDIETSSFYNKQNTFFTNDEFVEYTNTIYKNEYEKQLRKLKDKKRAERKATIAKVRAKEEFNKYSCMYIWQMAFGTNDTVLVGRTWQEWFEFLYLLKACFQLDEKKELKIGVHNLSYEFGFIKNYFTWGDCLLTDKTTYYASTKGVYVNDPDMPTGVSCDEFGGFRFFDTLILSGVKEENLPSLMTKYADKCMKQVGNLNYDLVRHSETELSNDEYAYCICDVLLLNWYIREKMEEYDNNICNIPMTKTGEVRNLFRDRLFYTNQEVKSKKDDKLAKYKQFLNWMKIDYATYQQIKRAFQGGFTHANFNNAGKVWENCVMSMDLASSYPAVICCKKFAMSPYILVEVENKEQFNYYINNKACLFDVCLEDLRPRYDEDGVDFDLIENIISIHKTEEYGMIFPDCKPLFPEAEEIYYNNNGRIRYADKIYLTINEVDWEAICLFYDFDKDKVKVDNFRIAEKGYLPKDIILFTLELFRNKTQYKPYDGTDTKEGLLYKIAKIAINSCFGMIATDNLKESYYLDANNNLVAKHSNINNDDELNEIRTAELNDYLDRFTTFLCYQWSHTLTSWARLNLFEAIIASGTNHVYSDTDSEKFIVNENTLKFREEYNANIDKQMNECFEYYGIPLNSHKATYEKDGKVIEKCLGYFELENKGKPYKKFATCGAKRYIVEDEEGVHITVAGLNKKSVEYLQNKYKDRLFKIFAKGEIVVDREHTGKLAATYIDYSTKGIVVDYLGKESKFAEICSVHLEKVEFNMKLTDEYEKLLSVGRMEEGL